jgi:hypothetical protein
MLELSSIAESVHPSERSQNAPEAFEPDERSADIEPAVPQHLGAPDPEVSRNRMSLLIV